MALQPARQRFLVEGDQRADKGPVVADDKDLGHQRVSTDLVLQQGRYDVLAARCDDDFLLAACDLQETLFVQFADVTRAEPPVHEGFRGEVIPLEVALHDADALGEDFAVVGNPDRVAGERGPTVPILIKDGVLTEMGAVVSVRP
ncbi:hypothetical protein AHiyo8_12220 [Arthrobacter sp. Hiyo8]|nr:hypothetical protein AHiyo8_12220 [Arthrobacter sp. Hiyo8]